MDENKEYIGKNFIYKFVQNGYFVDNFAHRAFRLTKGDIFYISGNFNVKPGDKYEDQPAVIFGVDYTHKKWWQFWKKKQVVGIHVMWLGEDSCN